MRTRSNGKKPYTEAINERASLYWHLLTWGITSSHRCRVHNLHFILSVELLWSGKGETGECWPGYPWLSSHALLSQRIFIVLTPRQYPALKTLVAGLITQHPDDQKNQSAGNYITHRCARELVGQSENSPSSKIRHACFDGAMADGPRGLHGRPVRHTCNL